MREPLASKMRPKTIDDILGQEHLVGKNGVIRKCIENKTFFSCIFFGAPGIGKTTLAKVIADELKMPYRNFNAVTGNKKDLDNIFLEAKMSDGLVLICDEVHRLNKDKQDLLLPHIEKGLITLIGATTANPYHSINPAIRSRCHLFEFKPLGVDDIKKGLNNALKNVLNNEYTIDEEALNHIGEIVNGDIRTALNILELATVLASDKHITKELIVNNIKNVNNRSFGSDDGYYNLLSAFQKAIRGSDANAALYYLALLAQANELDAINRRLLVIAYEDIGLANPQLVSRTINAVKTSEMLGFPEAIIPLGMHIIDLCLSSKSRTAVDAIAKVQEIADGKAYEIPDYLKFTPVTLSEDERYSYDRYDCFHKIQYLPDGLKDLDLLNSFANNRYEQNLKLVYDELKKQKRTNNLKSLYKK